MVEILENNKLEKLLNNSRPRIILRANYLKPWGERIIWVIRLYIFLRCSSDNLYIICCGYNFRPLSAHYNTKATFNSFFSGHLVDECRLHLGPQLSLPDYKFVQFNHSKTAIFLMTNINNIDISVVKMDGV